MLFDYNKLKVLNLDSYQIETTNHINRVIRSVIQLNNGKIVLGFYSAIAIMNEETFEIEKQFVVPDALSITQINDDFLYCGSERVGLFLCDIFHEDFYLNMQLVKGNFMMYMI